MTPLEVAEEKLQGELHPYLIYAKKLVSLSTSKYLKNRLRLILKNEILNF